jgi:hypothetical protein
LERTPGTRWVGPGVETRLSSAYRSHCIGWNIEEIKVEIKKKHLLWVIKYFFSIRHHLHTLTPMTGCIAVAIVLLGSLARATFKQNFSDIN